ncbi:uncharacterized protein F13E9.13, mitochondrial isoform X1 [Patella vulgata]|uniref:uncharacterized protein F13E9.13, mitochondrial isoform X1 n=1 Tax=Patella vulgata TaxID=6465 RepID=UPI00217F72FA|nr:uncharacterized protein F13E9.13, mitochondrial isoform X1 [Patella vulgata]XP_050399209.1 uncharacterized protein F13E9.13, mitochondrial isoform X1 [Patella vulgata]
MATSMERFIHTFKHKSAAVIGMIHLKALPGTPLNNHGVKEIIDIACNEARIYKEAGVDGVMVENMHDLPYLHTQVGPEITATMAIICSEVKRVFQPGPVGVQVLAGANKHAMAIANAANLQFIRAEGFVFSHVADEGLMNACAGELLRYRKQIGAENVMVFTDIKKKHSAHAITEDVNIIETAKAAELFLSNGVIITGTSTGQPASVKQVKSVLDSVHVPVLIGSGVTMENLDSFKAAQGLIIGSYFKRDGKWTNDIDADKLKRFMEKVTAIRTNPIKATYIM